jgi:hypothetical protein
MCLGRTGCLGRTQGLQDFWSTGAGAIETGQRTMCCAPERARSCCVAEGCGCQALGACWTRVGEGCIDRRRRGWVRAQKLVKTPQSRVDKGARVSVPQIYCHALAGRTCRSCSGPGRSPRHPQAAQRPRQLGQHPAPVLHPPAGPQHRWSCTTHWPVGNKRVKRELETHPLCARLDNSRLGVKCLGWG